ncbi:MAG: DUF4244 domain-containing protein [Actinobacteria bacterium]|nr:DUF4244 domain-containing protein [Actinomycetota bacterium]
MSELATRSSRAVSRLKRLDRGAVSAENALLTVGTITFGGLLLKIITDGEVRNQILTLVLAIIKLIFSHFGLL